MNNQQFFLEEAFEISKMSNCLHKQVGVVLVKNNQIIEKSYNIIPENIKSCIENGCMREKEKLKSGEKIERCNVVHAEQQLIINCALKQINPKGCDVYCTHSPCAICAKMLLNAKINNIYYAIKRDDNEFEKYLNNAYQINRNIK